MMRMPRGSLGVETMDTTARAQDLVHLVFRQLAKT